MVKSLYGDYKLTVNRTAKLDTYPIPTLDDLFSCLACGKISGVLLYLDDILISGITEMEHINHLRLMLSALKTAELKLSIDKCTMGVTNVAYICYRIDKKSLHPTNEFLLEDYTSSI